MPGSYPSRPKVEFDDEGRIVTLLEDFVYIDSDDERWTAPKGAKADGASIPQALWSLMGGPFEGKYRNASIIHDFYCSKRHRPWKAVHRMFYNAMITSGVGRARSGLMYGAVYRWGPRWTEMDTYNTLLQEAAPAVSFLSERVGTVVGSLIGVPAISLMFEGRSAEKRRIVEIANAKKPKVRRRRAMTDEEVEILQVNLQTRSSDLDFIERQVDEMFSSKPKNRE